ncbi:histidine phosphatase family protein [Rossellomorea sp. NRS-1567]|uniref:histidine phosphatase family protein n=1 Tax=Rossellomorea sp. NRS-1567 TaxID=3233901 RepID=UPI003D2A2443
MDDYMVIACIRHGLTDENEQGKYLGWTNSNLSQKGIELLKRRNTLFEEYERCFSSDLNRCLETAHILFPHAPLISSSLLRELHFGSWEGLTYESLKEDDVYQEWILDPSISPPNGEGMNQFGKRVELAWAQIIKQIEEHNGKRYAVITHGGVIRHLLTSLSPRNVHRTFWEWEVNHGAGYELVWKTENDWRNQTCTSLREVPLMGKADG